MPCVVVIALAPVVTVNEPRLLPVTATVTVHVAPTASVAFASENVVPPPVALSVPLAHVVAALGDDASVSPAGSVCVKARPPRAIALVPVFAIVMVSGDVVVATIDAGEKALVTASGDGVLTDSVALVGARLVTFCVVATASVAIRFVSLPVALAVTVAENAQLAPAASVPLVRLSVEPLVEALPDGQVVAAFGVVANVTFVGNAELSCMPLRATAPLPVLAMLTV
jgi:hypothetical protein